MSADIETWVAPIAAAGVAFGTLAHYFRAFRNIDKAIQEVRDEYKKQLQETREQYNCKLHDLESKFEKKSHEADIEVKVLKSQMTVWIDILQKELPKIIMHEDEADIDEGLRRLSQSEMTDKEKAAFINKLKSKIYQNIQRPESQQDRMKNMFYLMTMGGMLSDLKGKQVRSELTSTESTSYSYTSNPTDSNNKDDDEKGSGSTSSTMSMSSDDYNNDNNKG